MRKFGLPLVADTMTEILVMGTLPSDLSITKQEYYGNPANDFWRLISAALNRDVTAMPYGERLAVLRSHHIGLWDAYHNCVRLGSLDTAITDPELNDFSILKTVAPKLRLVCFNGKEAARSDEKIRGLGYETCVLPSSSSANRKNRAERLRLWRSMLT